MTATAAALEAVEPLLLRHGWRLDEIHRQPLPRLLRHLQRYAPPEEA
jgi:hypothetical protein